jgi:hypothetical protein
MEMPGDGGKDAGVTKVVDESKGAGIALSADVVAAAGEYWAGCEGTRPALPPEGGAAEEARGGASARGGMPVPAAPRRPRRRRCASS